MALLENSCELEDMKCVSKKKKEEKSVVHQDLKPPLAVKYLINDKYEHREGILVPASHTFCHYLFI